MKTFYLTIFCCLALTGFSFSQQEELSDSEKNKLKRFQEDVERHQLEYVTDFIATLKVDDFQKEIITQTLNSYFDELVKINQMRLKHYERETQIHNLDKRHFTDVEAIVSEDVMLKIMDAAKGKWDQKKEKKKKKKERKKKRKKDN